MELEVEKQQKISGSAEGYGLNGSGDVHSCIGMVDAYPDLSSESRPLQNMAHTSQELTNITMSAKII